MIQIAKQRRIGGHPVHRTPTNASNLARKPADNFVPLDEDKQTHPLMRCIQDRWIAPGQPSQILPIHAEFLRSLNDVAEVLTQSARRSLVAKMRKRCGPPRKHRHQRLPRLGQLGLQSGPRPPRRLKIRLITRISNGFSFPRRPPLSHTKLAFAQRRLEPFATLQLAPQMRLKPQRTQCSPTRREASECDTPRAPSSHFARRGTARRGDGSSASTTRTPRTASTSAPVGRIADRGKNSTSLRSQTSPGPSRLQPRRLRG